MTDPAPKPPLKEVPPEKVYALPESLGQALADYLMRATPPRDQEGGVLVALCARLQALEEVAATEGDDG